MLKSPFQGKSVYMKDKILERALRIARCDTSHLDLPVTGITTDQNVMYNRRGGPDFRRMSLPDQNPEKYLAEQFLGVAKGIQAMHDADYIHRDIKPENMLTSLGAEPAKLTDFGLAVKSSYQGNRTTGTPGYIEPSAFASLRDQINRIGQQPKSTDWYSLGRSIEHVLFRRVLMEGQAYEKLFKAPVDVEDEAIDAFEKEHSSEILVWYETDKETNKHKISVFADVQTRKDKMLEILNQKHPGGEFIPLAELAYALMGDVENRPSFQEITLQLSEI